MPEKVFQYLIHLFDSDDTRIFHEFIISSIVYIARDSTQLYSEIYNLKIVTDPEVYKKYHNFIDSIEREIIAKIRQFTKLYIYNVETIPDLRKFRILENKIVPVNTPWEKINVDQSRIVSQLRTATEILDFQNIGNSCRMLLQNLSNIVFKANQHISTEKSVDLSEGKFKNRLRTYIKCELNEKQNEELKEYGLAIVIATEKSVDLANKVTHDLNASALMAEFCVESTWAVVNIVKLIDSKRGL